MVLDSQLTRDGARHRHMAARGRRLLKSWLGGVLLIAVVVGGVALFWHFVFGGDEATIASDDGGSSVALDATAPPVDDGRAPEPDDEVDVVDEQPSADPPPVTPTDIEPVDAGAADDLFPPDVDPDDSSGVDAAPPDNVSDTDPPTLDTEPVGQPPEDLATDKQDDPVLVKEDDKVDPEPKQDDPAEPDEPDKTSSLADELARIERSRTDVEARALMSRLLDDRADELTKEEQKLVRTALFTINKKLVYSNKYVRDDPLAERYVVKPGDALSKIARRYKTDYRFLAQINRLSSPDKINVRQKLKVIRGPFHAVVDKSDFRLDLYLIDPSGQRIYINSLQVGLGEDDSTPPGKWVVKPRSKVINPQYVDPDGKHYAPDDPKNPIGEYWIGLEGAEEKTADLEGYGIHGTIEPKSIGKQASMGCIRLGKEDVALLYSVMMEGESTVTVVP